VLSSITRRWRAFRFDMVLSGSHEVTKARKQKRPMRRQLRLRVRPATRQCDRGFVFADPRLAHPEVREAVHVDRMFSRVIVVEKFFEELKRRAAAN
jgi:hypothetical protein